MVLRARMKKQYSSRGSRRDGGHSETRPHANPNLKSYYAAFLIADADCFFHLAKEDFSVADISRRCRLQNGVDSGINQILRQHQLQLDFRKKIDRVFAASINLRVTLLTSVAANIGDGHSADSQFGKDFLDSFKSGRLNDRFQFCHHSFFLLPAGLHLELAPSICVRRFGYSRSLPPGPLSAVSSIFHVDIRKTRRESKLQGVHEFANPISDTLLFYSVAMGRCG